tara:strand:+ start:18129 stop:19529 length:1401 start_codon:yes stop_codon:yes gene_type:complete
VATNENEQDLPDKSHNMTMYVDQELVDAVRYVPIDALKGYRRHARKHSKRQRRTMERMLREFGFLMPVLIDGECNVVAGHLRMAAANGLGYTKVPTIQVTHLTSEQVRALRIADNRLAELGEWDREALAREFQDLIEIDYDVEMTGFEAAEIDMVIEEFFEPVAENGADDVPAAEQEIVSMLGDLWLLDEHAVYCGDARDSTCYAALMRGRRAQMMISDPPYNVRVAGNVSGLGKVKHGEFVMASGEMSETEFEAFLTDYIKNVVAYSEPGSVHYHFIDWRHLNVLERVCHKFYDAQLNLCVWVKSNGGMGSFYRSRHELVLVFRNGPGPHINNVKLGSFGRNRTNVWEYDGCSTGTKDRRTDLALHPTVKPAEMIADAIKDASKRGGLILDPFLGSGTTVIACEMTGRRCVGMELDPKYVDVIVRRWQAYTGGEAVHAETGLTFAQIGDMRAGKLLLAAPADGEA